MCKQSDSQSQNLCQDCGLCCDGTLFDSVTFHLQDALQPLQLAGISLQQKENEQYFLQPCAAHKNQSCAIYEHRPKVCREFQCQLLLQFQNGETSLEKAKAIVVETVRQRDELFAAMQAVMKLPRNLSLKHTTEVFDKTQRRIYGDEVVKNFPGIFLQVAVLQVYLKKFFQKKLPTPD
jgi:uncharacterized protein